jgi:hypothetical protein
MLGMEVRCDVSDKACGCCEFGLDKVGGAQIVSVASEKELRDARLQMVMLAEK